MVSIKRKLKTEKSHAIYFQKPLLLTNPCKISLQMAISCFYLVFQANTLKIVCDKFSELIKFRNSIDINDQQNIAHSFKTCS